MANVHYKCRLNHVTLLIRVKSSSSGNRLKKALQNHRGQTGRIGVFNLKIQTRRVKSIQFYCTGCMSLFLIFEVTADAGADDWGGSHVESARYDSSSHVVRT
ncbi:hypothetical protein COLO4_06820 [Corchorus olitorius]|uniref:Uncharacterized protein n=1 Tax=Corchorus olitorius TaxID=93759 RepID=A0A1R3KLU1_9ROSI|nr:hypothetical protein COLO4_06820 [Corchorus olitorius]